jgi:hypothetical protein
MRERERSDGGAMDDCSEDALDHVTWTCHDAIYKVFFESGSDSNDNDQSHSNGASKPTLPSTSCLSLLAMLGPPKRTTKFDATSASTAGATEVEDIEPLLTTFGKIINDGAHAGQEECEHEDATHWDRWGS